MFILVEGAVINVLEALHLAILSHMRIIWARNTTVIVLLQVGALEIVDL